MRKEGERRGDKGLLDNDISEQRREKKIPRDREYFLCLELSIQIPGQILAPVRSRRKVGLKNLWTFYYKRLDKQSLLGSKN